MKADLLRFNGVVERDPQWFEVMRKCGDEVRELLHDGCPVAYFGDAPFGYVNVVNSHVNVGSFTAQRRPIRLACCKARASSCVM